MEHIKTKPFSLVVVYFAWIVNSKYLLERPNAVYCLCTSTRVKKIHIILCVRWLIKIFHTILEFSAKHQIPKLIRSLVFVVIQTARLFLSWPLWNMSRYIIYRTKQSWLLWQLTPWHACLHITTTFESEARGEDEIIANRFPAFLKSSLIRCLYLCLLETCIMEGSENRCISSVSRDIKFVSFISTLCFLFV